MTEETTQPAPSENTETECPPLDNAQNAMIEADGLSKFYGEFAASRNVNFKINRGEVVAFLDPTVPERAPP